MSKPISESIYPAMAAILRDIDKIAKERKNEQQGFKFRSIDDAYDHLHPIFAAHGVICLPSVEDHTLSDFINAKGNRTNVAKVKVLYTFSAIDGSFAQARTVGEAFDMADKATAKALSAAHKYLLFQTFLIPVGGVEDGDFYDPSVMPRDELKRLAEERAKAEVLSGKPAEEIGLPGNAEAELEAKREELRKQIAEKDAKQAQESPERPLEGARAAKPAKAPQKTPEKPQETHKQPEDWRNYVISQITLAKFKGKSLTELSVEDITLLKTSWVDRYAEKIAANPAKAHEAAMIERAFAEISK